MTWDWHVADRSSVSPPNTVVNGKGNFVAEYIDVAGTDELRDGEKMVVEAEDQILVLLRRGDEFFCLDDVCTHDGGPLSDGCFDGDTIACPRHGAKFDIRTGQALTMPATQPTSVYPTKVENGRVMIQLPS